MDEAKRQGGLDACKLLAALLVVAIHTSPLAELAPLGDFFLTRVLGRLAVPFFFMVTGHFVLGPVLAGGAGRVWRQIQKLLLLYAAAILLYLPIGLYAGHYQQLGPLGLLRLVLFDGTFYHLWYFPACAMGLGILWLLSRFLKPKGLLAVTGLLYLAALLGDSYYGLTACLPSLAAVYDLAFQVFSYTRNGLLMAPLFLLLGALLGRSPGHRAPVFYGLGFLLSFTLMTGEAFALCNLSLPRHDSMYLLLPLVVFFLYRLLLSWSPAVPAGLSSVATGVYILHPAMIVAVRGMAKAFDLAGLLVANSLVHYLAVCTLSFLAAWAIVRVKGRLFPPPPRRERAWLTLDRAALAHNVAALQALLPPGCRLMPALKANAYGHGALPVARALARLGVDAFCVACLSEGIQLRKGGIRGAILLLGPTQPRHFPLLRRYRLTQTVVDFAYAQQLAAFGKPLSVHLAVDTGMHRLGIPAARLEDLAAVFALPHLRVTGIYSHLCTADSTDPAGRGYAQRQRETFRQVLEELRNRGIPLPKVHLLASHGLLNCPEAGGDWARAGIALYGLLSTPEDRNEAAPDLRPVLSLQARVALVRDLPQGAAAGYGLAFTARRPTKLAVLTIGYADGLPRCLTGGHVLLHGRLAPIVGRICMDLTFVDVTDLPPVAAGDIATLMGTDGGQTITALDLARQSGTLSNEILSRLGSRLERYLS